MLLTRVDGNSLVLSVSNGGTNVDTMHFERRAGQWIASNSVPGATGSVERSLADNQGLFGHPGVASTRLGMLVDGGFAIPRSDSTEPWRVSRVADGVNEVENLFRGLASIARTRGMAAGSSRTDTLSVKSEPGANPFIATCVTRVHAGNAFSIEVTDAQGQSIATLSGAVRSVRAGNRTVLDPSYVATFRGQRVDPNTNVNIRLLGDALLASYSDERPGAREWTIRP